MKKYIAILLVAAMATLGISACRKENSNKETKVQKDSDIKVVTTIFPEYDWVREKKRIRWISPCFLTMVWICTVISRLQRTS